MGAVLAGFGGMLLQQERRLQLGAQARRARWARSSPAPPSASAGRPASGPTLAAILALAGRSGHALDGAVLLAVYSLGLGVPFLLSGLLFTRGLSSLAPLRRHAPLLVRGFGRRADGARRAARARSDDGAHERSRERVPGARLASTTSSSRAHHAHRTPARVEREAGGPADPQGEESDRHARLPGRAAPIAAFTWESHEAARWSHIRRPTSEREQHAHGCARRRAPRPGAGRRREHEAVRPGAAAGARRDAARAPDAARALEADPGPAVLETGLDPAAAAHVVDEQMQARGLAAAREAGADGERSPRTRIVSPSMRARTRSVPATRSAGRGAAGSREPRRHSASCDRVARAPRTCRRRRPVRPDEVRLAPLRVGPDAHARRRSATTRPLTRPRATLRPAQERQRCARAGSR